MKMKKPEIGSDGIVLKDGDVVLIHRKYEPEGWSLPGGFVEYGERIKETCKREVREETGLEVEIVPWNGPSPEFSIYDSPDRDPRRHVVSIVFLCEARSDKLDPGPEIEEVKAFPLEEALQLDLVLGHDQVLRDLKDADAVEHPKN